MMKFIVEGYSKVSEAAALGDAMSKATAYLSDSHDVNIAIRELTEMPGRGFRAVLEVTVIPMTSRDTLHRKGQDIERRRLEEKEYRKRFQYGERHKRAEIDSYLSRTLGYGVDVPDILMADFKEADLLNYRVEKDFFYAVRLGKRPDVPDADVETPALRDVLGKKRKPAPPRAPEPE